MKLIILTEEEAATVSGFYGDDNLDELKPVLDNAGRYILNENVLSNPAFTSVFELLNSFPQEEFSPK